MSRKSNRFGSRGSIVKSMALCGVIISASASADTVFAPTDETVPQAASTKLPVIAAVGANGATDEPVAVGDVAPIEAVPTTSSAAKSSWNLTSGERIHLRVIGNSELTGEYRTNPDQTISIPGVGRVPINTMSPSDFETYLAKRLSSATRREVSVSVEIARFKPFYVTGQVDRPGAVEWQPNLTLIQALSLAGGIFRSPTSTELGSSERGLLLEQARIQHRFALVQLARLQAEQQGQDTVESTKLVEELLESALPGSKQALKSYLARQNGLLSEQRNIIRARVARLETDRQTASAELESARTQETAIRKQLENSTELASSVERLKNQRLVSSSRYLEQQRDLIDSKVRHSESQALVERARGRVSTVSRDIEAVQQERRTVLNDRIEGLEREVAQLELTLRNAEEGGISITESPQDLTYNIARSSSSGLQTISANLFTEILAGDVVIVSRQPREEARTTASATEDGAKTVATAIEQAQQIIELSATPRASAARPR